MTVANETYIIPRGWCRFGLHVPPLIKHYNNILEKWTNAYHGTTAKNALSIIQHGQFLINGDTTFQGVTIRTRASVDDDQSYYFVSPHICYASHPWYSEINKFCVFRGKLYYAQIVIMVKVRPKTYQKHRLKLRVALSEFLMIIQLFRRRKSSGFLIAGERWCHVECFFASLVRKENVKSRDSLGTATNLDSL